MKKIQILSIIMYYFIDTLPMHAATSISLFNPGITTTAVGAHPAGMAITADGLLLYVANSSSDTVSVINIKTNKVITTITGFDQPNTITINPAGTKAYVTNSRYGGANTVSIIDLNAKNITTYNTIIATIAGFNGPSGMAITSDGKFGYVINFGNPNNVVQAGNTVNYVNLTTNAIVGPAITVGLYPSAIALAPNNAYAYVTNFSAPSVSTGSVSVIDTNTAHTTTFNTVLKTISGFFGPMSIAVTANGALGYVTNYGNNPNATSGTTVSVINLNNASSTAYTIINTITVGPQPLAIAIDPAGNYAYVTLYGKGGTGKLVTIQINNNTVVTPAFTLPHGPNQIAIAPNRLQAFVTNYTGATISTLSFANTFALSLFNIPSPIQLFVNNLYQNNISAETLVNNVMISTVQTLTLLITGITIAPPAYNIYYETAQFTAAPLACSGQGAPYISTCSFDNTNIGIRIFINTAIINTNAFYYNGSYSSSYYYDIAYTNIPAGANSFAIDLKTQIGLLTTTAGTTTYAATPYTIPPNY